jgi:transposase
MNGSGRVVNRKKLRREELLSWALRQGSRVVAFEACGGSQYWARRFSENGFEVRMIAGQFVKPFVKSNKNDVLDAEAICEAASRPQMRLVGIRTEEQQDLQNLHRIRERLVNNRTALCNEIRGLLLEYGIVVPKGVSKLRKLLPSLIEEYGTVSALWKETFKELYAELTQLDERLEHYDKRIAHWAQSHDVTRRLMEIPGVGELTATAVYASVGNPNDFKNGRQFSAWVGLTPKQYSTGGKTRLGGISKRGDKYLRKLLILGARSSAIAAKRRKTKGEATYTDQWLFQIAHRRGGNRAIVALANKTARQILVVLKGEKFRHPQELLPLAA